MPIELDHVLVPARDRRASAQLLATLLGVPWSQAGVGPFSPVFVNDGLTLDFDESGDDFRVQHLCFRVDDAAFDAILGRIRAHGFPIRSMPGGPEDGQVNTAYGGRVVYWGEPDGHVWEMLTHSYARQPVPDVS